jgi:hypothetical protein
METISYTRIQINKLNDLLDLLSESQTSSRFMKRLIYNRLVQTGFISHNDEHFVYPNTNTMRSLIILTNDLYNIYDTCFFPTSAILVEQYDCIKPTTHEKLIHVCEPLICWLLKFRLQLFEPIENYNKKVTSITHCIYLLNNHRSRARLFRNKEQQKLVLDKIQYYKEQLKIIADEFNIELSENVKLELSRGERIYRILTTEAQLEEKVSPNIKQVIQNNDLNRYLMEFIE